MFGMFVVSALPFISILLPFIIMYCRVKTIDVLVLLKRDLNLISSSMWSVQSTHNSHIDRLFTKIGFFSITIFACLEWNVFMRKTSGITSLPLNYVWAFFCAILFFLWLFCSPIWCIRYSFPPFRFFSSHFVSGQFVCVCILSIDVSAFYICLHAAVRIQLKHWTLFPLIKSLPY